MIKKLLIHNYKNKIINTENVLNKCIYISYILNNIDFIPAFLKKKHPNHMEVQIIINVMKKWFRKIIVSDYRYKGTPPGCEIAFGFGENINRISATGVPVICYATGASNLYQLSAVQTELEKLSADGFKIDLGEFRVPDGFFGITESLAQKIYLIGNSWTRSTYGNNSSKVRLLPGMPLGMNDPNRDEATRGIEQRQNTLLWVGSKGLLHKGLPLAAMVAKETGFELRIAGVTASSYEYCKKIIQKIGCRVQYNGYLNVGTSKWNNFISGAVGVLGTSISEGMSTSLLTAALYGVVPISLDSCGIDIGIIIKSNKINNILIKFEDSVSQLAAMPQKQFDTLRLETVNRVEKENSPIKFHDLLASYILDDLEVFGNG